MKLLGLIGGMTFESTAEYYRLINEGIKERLGEWNSAPLLLYSVEFNHILELQNKGEWNLIAKEMINIAQKLEKAGSKALFICSNTMHKIADDVENTIHIPLIHVIDATAEQIKKDNVSRVGLLGTIFTMEGEFYTNRMKKHGIECIVPEAEDRQKINSIIYNELAKGIKNEESQKFLIETIIKLSVKGANGIILGCTELPMLIDNDVVTINLYDTLKLHIDKAVEFILDNKHD